MKPLILALCGLVLLLGSACEQSTPPAEKPEAKTELSTPATEPAGDAATETPELPPLSEAPMPPIFEDFEGKPQLSLFPRIGDYQPPRGDERHPFWETFINHFSKVSGVSTNQDDPPNHAWSFRSIKSLESVGYFSPLRVEPETEYKVSLRMESDLPEGVKIGSGVLEFDEFSWLGQQYTEEMITEHLAAPAHIGVELTGKNTLDTLQEYRFTTGPKTRMIHLVFFREGEHDRLPVLLDDIRIEPAKQE